MLIIYIHTIFIRSVLHYLYNIHIRNFPLSLTVSTAVQLSRVKQSGTTACNYLYCWYCVYGNNVIILHPQDTLGKSLAVRRDCRQPLPTVLNISYCSSTLYTIPPLPYFMLAAEFQAIVVLIFAWFPPEGSDTLLYLCMWILCSNQSTVFPIKYNDITNYFL